MSTYPDDGDFPVTPTSRWLMDEASGNAIALTGGIDLTDNGSVGATTGYSAPGATFDNSRDFIPSNDFFSAADNTAFDCTGAFSFNVFFKPNNLTTASGIFSKWSGTQRSYQGFQRNDGKFNFAVNSTGSGGGVEVVSASSLTVDTWHMLTFVYVPSTRITLYVDGAEVAENTTSIPASVFNSSTAFTIGAIDSAGTTTDAQMNDASLIKGTAMSDAQVTALWDLYQTSLNTVSGSHIFFT